MIAISFSPSLSLFSLSLSLSFFSSGNCTWKANWNAYYCQGLQHRMLVIESMDGDSEVRRLSPVALVGETTWQYTDLLNGPMDHGKNNALMIMFVVC